MAFCYRFCSVTVTLCVLSGRLFDKDGNVKQWWSSVDVAKFIERAQCFIDQYSNYTVPEVDMNVSADCHMIILTTLNHNLLRLRTAIRIH